MAGVKVDSQLATVTSGEYSQGLKAVVIIAIFIIIICDILMPPPY
jgi:hypothetical protein